MISSNAKQYKNPLPSSQRTPTLETERLLLRPFENTDAKDVFDGWGNDADMQKKILHPEM